jgi:hypothetical protein
MPVKVGYAIDPLVRMRGLQTGSSDELRLLFVAPGDQQDEVRVHHRFADARMAGEWFTGPLLSIVLAYAEAVSSYLIAIHDGSPRPPSFPAGATIRAGDEVREVRRAIESWTKDRHVWSEILELAQLRFPGWTEDEIADQRQQMKRSSLYDLKVPATGWSNGPRGLERSKGDKDDLEHRHSPFGLAGYDPLEDDPE